MVKIIGVRFRKAGKIYNFAPGNLKIEKGDHVIVETVRGVEYGSVVLGIREIEDEKITSPLKNVIRIAYEEFEAGRSFPACLKFFSVFHKEIEPLAHSGKFCPWFDIYRVCVKIIYLCALH